MREGLRLLKMCNASSDCSVTLMFEKENARKMGEGRDEEL